ncbi:MAG: hypothetical protein M1839_007860 [Geoglossum umbratile]|nr:MAG: hypothetical protein M1839_007860 [Geoglossum umbratile]
MCLRMDHNSAIKNNVLYIDGGRESYVRNNTGGSFQGNISLGYNNWLIMINMTESWDWKTNISESYIDKTKNPKTGDKPPVVVRGAFYQGSSTDDNIYLYGGTTSYQNTSFFEFVPPSPSKYSLWSYDTKNNTWDQFDISDASPNRPCSGSFAEAPELGLAFFLNGGIDSGSSKEVQPIGSDAKIWLKGMIVIDTHKRTARNLSTDALLGGNPRSRGKMIYVPGIGKKGILVALGGSYKPASDSSNTVIGTLLSMRFIDVFDVASLDDGPDGTWYTQQTSGDFPDPRVEPCLVVASAPDNSSHNIYMYGGRNLQTTFDQIYVLSIPSFTWSKVHDGFQPRYGMTCHLVGNRQLLSVGGFSTFNLSTSCDWEDKGVHIFDMSQLSWGSLYNAYAENYTVPVQVVRQIGGSPSGSATMTAPISGFTSPPFAQLFGQSNSTNSTKLPIPAKSSTPPSPSPSSRVSKGAIAGAVIGSIAGLSMIAGALTFLFRRNQRPRSHISAYEISAPVAAPAYEVAGSDIKPPVELEHGQATYVELPVEQAVEIRGTELVRSEDMKKDVLIDGPVEAGGTGLATLEDIKKDVPDI